MDLQRQIGQVLAELELISEVAAMNLEPSRGNSEESIGGKRPPGGIDRKGDRDQDNEVKSFEYYRKQFARCHTDARRLVVLTAAEEALERAKRQPLPSGGDPAYGTPQWKRWVAASGEFSHGDIARRFNVSRQYVIKIRHQYGEAA